MTQLIPNHKIRVPYEYDEQTIQRVFDEFIDIRDNRLKILADYYAGYQEIRRTKVKGAKIVVNFCDSIVDDAVSYIAGDAPEYIFEDGDKYGEDIIERFDYLKLQNMEPELLRDMTLYGVAYELVYHDTDPGDESESSQSLGDVKSIRISPLQAFVAWDYSASPDSVFGAYVFDSMDNDNIVTHHMYLYTDTILDVWEGRADNNILAWKSVKKYPHNFGRVPLVQYSNGTNMASDIEQIIDLQDSYNRTKSDMQDSEDAFANAMLVTKGTAFVDSLDDSMSDSEKYDSTKAELKDRKVVNVEKDGDLFYLTKQTNATESIASLDSTEQKIYQITGIPKFTDESFAGNASGVALQFKLFKLNLKSKLKARQFSIGFSRRCKLYSFGMFNTSDLPDFESPAEIDKMGIIFKLTTINDPVADANAIISWKSTGVVSDRTLMEHASIITDPDQEEERLAKQNTQSMAREKELYSDEFAIAKTNGNTPASDEVDEDGESI